MMSAASSDVGAGPAAADGAVRDGDAVSSSNLRGLSNEPEGEEIFQKSPKRSRTELAEDQVECHLHATDT